MSRKKKLLLNSGIGLIRQIVAVICGFILPRYIILYYGSEVNGLVSSISHFLGFISLLEMGIGPVIQANLYRPLAQKDNEEISKIIISAEKFFKRIAGIFLVYIVILAFVFPKFINTKYDAGFSISLILIISISTFVQYFFGITYQLLLNADQKSYVQNILQILTTTLTTLFCIVLIRAGASLHMVKLLTALIFLLRPFGQILYVRKHYKLNKKIKLIGEPIKQKWNGFAQHFAAVICGNVDVVVLTFFSSFSNVSIYSVYFNVINGVTTMIMMTAIDLESYFGNIIAKRQKEILDRSFEIVEWVVHTIVTIVFTVTAITIVPFISIYTLDFKDASYSLPVFGILLTLAYAAQCLRVPYFRIIKAAGHFKETQNGAFISALLNVLISIVLVFKLELIGIAVGTLVAMLYHTCYFAWYLQKNILNRFIGYFVKYLFSDVIVFGVSYLLTNKFILEGKSYLLWVLLACRVTMVTVAISIIVNLVINGKVILKFVKNFWGKIV